MSEKFKLWSLRILLLAPALILLALAIPRLIDGLALEAAFPVPTYMEMNVHLPKSSYRDAAKVLAHADPADGEAQIARAEAAMLGGAPRKDVIPVLENGLAHAPASSRGWTILSELLAPGDPKRAGKALTLALELAPYDYFLAGRRARDGAMLWNALDADGRSAVLRQTRLIWSEKLLHKEMAPLIASPGGAALVQRAFADSPEDIRAINRMLARERMGLPEK